MPPIQPSSPGLPPPGFGARLLRFWLSWRMLVIGTAGFLAGYLAMWNVQFQLIWLVAACIPAGISCLRKSGVLGLTRDPIMVLAGAFILWNLAVGLVRNPETLSLEYTQEFLAGTILLPVYLTILWLVCRRGEGASILLQTVVWAGLAAAAGGLLYWWLVQTVEEPGARLRNPLVHGGLHPVTTGITIGFAVMAAAVWYGKTSTVRMRWAIAGSIAVMCLAVMLTLCRGALFALSIAFLVPGPALLASVSLKSAWKQVWPPTAIAAAVVFGFLLFGGALAPKPGEIDEASSGNTMLTDDPLREYFSRGDSGRASFYRCGIESLDTWDKHLTGAGLWGPELTLEAETGGNINHFHSLFVATYIHSGIIGSAILAALLALAVRRASTLARAGQPQWLVLLVYGLAVLINDGQSACSLVTHARFENLVLWFPLVAIAASWRNGENRREITSG
ncbi:MAG TPA: O-antigen ligase family protein [Verrucomicrobiales bacterium]|nr:O-antigen ligase family protein [Verrucomicrobiales bacterium]